MNDITGFALSPQQAQWWRYRDGFQLPNYLQLKTHNAYDIDALNQRLNLQLASEEILRTRLQRLPGMEYPLQVIEQTSNITLTHKDWTTLHEKQVQEQLNALTRVATEQLLAIWITLPQTAGQPCFILHLSAPGWMLDHTSLQLLGERVLGLAQAPADPLHYVDYSQWKQTLLDDEPSHPGLAFWQEQTTGTLPSLPLQTHSTPYKPVSLSFTLSTDLLSSLTVISEQQAIAINQLLHCLWSALLTRHVQPDPMPAIWYETCRNDDTSDALGLYAQTLICQQQFNPDQPLLAQVKPFADTLSLANGWQEYFPGLHSERIPTLFAWLTETPLLQRSDITLYDIGAINTAAALQLICLPQSDNTLSCRLIASTHHYDTAVLQCLAEQWQQLMHSVIDKTDTALARLSLLGEQQRQCIAPGFANKSATPLSFLQRWSQSVERHGDKVAVSEQSKSMTYSELNQYADNLAHYLYGEGIGRGDIVGIHLPRGLDAITAIVATLKTGAAYLPLDPGYPDERLSYMIHDSGVRFIIGGDQTQSCNGVTYFSLHADITLPVAPATLAPPVNREDTAYLIYTSGSVGQPKAVEISHDNLSHSLEARLHYYTEPVKAFLMLSSLSFDSSVAGIFWTLSQGGELVLPASGEERDANVLLALMVRHGISHGLSLPSIYDALIGGASASQRQTLQENLSVWIVAGESCADTLVDKHHQHFPDTRLVNEYGPTEATVWATAGELRAGQPVTIGQPIPGMAVYLLNQYNEPVAIGETGEIHLAGAQLSNGYRGKPKQTAEAFITLAHIADGKRVYRTGDLARWRADGCLQFLGRRDHQVKIRGHRIEPGEIEKQLARQKNVQRVAVVTRDVGNTQRLVAYIIAEGDDIDTDALRNDLSATMPDYMVPGDFVVVSHFPLTPNGKLNINALPQPWLDPDLPYTAPRNDVEQTLADIIGELLQRKRVGIYDNFFYIGGDSILSLQVVSRALSHGLSVSAQAIFELKTIAQIAPTVTMAEDTPEQNVCQTQHTALVALDDSEFDALLEEVNNADI